MNQYFLHASIFFFLTGLLTSCTSNLSTLTPTNTLVARPTNQDATSVAVPPTEALPTLPHTTIDPSTMTGKLMMGYQGWFACPGDGSNIYNGYYHWIKDGYPSLNSESFRVDMWPDTNELGTSDLWQDSVVEFRKDLQQMEAMVKDPSTDLHARITHGDGQTVLREALLIADHNAYHLGVLTVMARILKAVPQ